jgi:hypothetical protein
MAKISSFENGGGGTDVLVDNDNILMKPKERIYKCVVHSSQQEGEKDNRLEDQQCVG